MPNTYFQEHGGRFQLILEALNAGAFEFDIEEEASWLSDKTYKLLGYLPNEIHIDKQYFLRYLVPKEYRDSLIELVDHAIENKIPFEMELPLRLKNENYHWFKLLAQIGEKDNHSSYIIGTLVDVDEQVQQRIAHEKSELLLEETGVMARVGGWELYTNPPSLTWSKEVCIIHEVPENFEPELSTAIQFYSPSYRPLIEEAVAKALSQGLAFDLELKIVTLKQRELWVRALGKPIYDSKSGEIIGTRGVFQDINEQKEREFALRESLNLVDEQNKRLLNFAHIVSHNLRSHASNLALTLELLNQETDANSKLVLEENVGKISHALNDTIQHLNEVVVAQTSTQHMLKKLVFDEVFAGILDVLQSEINAINAKIEIDFSECPGITYVPAYLESILLNLTSNAIKYRDPKKPLVISIRTSLHNGKPELRVCDNGLGIDMEKHGNQLFGMYKTFHSNANARGIGLFITKNQIESLGGSIRVESKPGQGAQFIIQF